MRYCHLHGSSSSVLTSGATGHTKASESGTGREDWNQINPRPIPPNPLNPRVPKSWPPTNPGPMQAELTAISMSTILLGARGWMTPDTIPKMPPGRSNSVRQAAAMSRLISRTDLLRQQDATAGPLLQCQCRSVTAMRLAVQRICRTRIKCPSTVAAVTPNHPHFHRMRQSPNSQSMEARASSVNGSRLEEFTCGAMIIRVGSRMTLRNW